MDEIEAAGQIPPRVQARKATLRLGMVNQTDQRAARGLNRLQRTGTLPPRGSRPGRSGTSGISRAPAWG